jgi:ACS family glucarate transporter-like MFS transporter
LRLKSPAASRNVLILLCVMYFVTYVDRVNVATAAIGFKQDLGLSNTDLGLVFSVFGYPYLVCQIIGGWFSDRFGARWTLTVCGVIWASATIATGFAGGLTSLLLARMLLGLGEGATFPTATRAMASWLPGGKSGWAQGIVHACARLGNAITPPFVVALMALVSWRGSFFVTGIISLVWVASWAWYFRDDPRQHKGISAADAERLPPARIAGGARQPVPWGPLTRRMVPVIFVYFCYGWTLWMFLSWIPQFLLHAYDLNVKNSAIFASLVFVGGVAGDALGGVVTDWILRRTGSLLHARRNMIIVALGCSVLCTVPILFVHSATAAAVSLAAAFFFAEMVIGPIWAIPMDIAPAFSGTASGLMNSGSAVAAILSPLVFGMVIDATGNWTLPFVASIALMVIGVVASFWMRPDLPFAAGQRAEARLAGAAA